MSDQLSFTATTRTSLGSMSSKALRTAGKVPVTLSRPGKPSLHLQVENKTAEEMAKVLHLAKLTIGTETVIVLKSEISRHCIKDNIEHIDLIQVDEKSEIKVDVNVAPDARNCPGVKAGGIVEQRLRRVRVRCKANAIPDSIGVSLDDVQIMQTVYADKLVMPKGVTLLTSPKQTVLSIVITRGMAKTETPADADPKAAAKAPAAAAKAPAAAAGAKAPAPAKKDEKKK